MKLTLQKRLLRVAKVVHKLAAVPRPDPRTLAQELESRMALCYKGKVLDQKRAGFLLRKLNEILPVVTDEGKKALIKSAMKRLYAGLATGQLGPESVTAKFRRVAKALLELVK